MFKYTKFTGRPSRDFHGLLTKFNLRDHADHVTKLTCSMCSKIVF